MVNPTKVDDDEAFRKDVSRAMESRGWDEPLWLETTPDDPGRGQAESAVAAGVSLVLACGGDGTVTACAEGVTGAGVPLGIIPLGTGNLLARNLSLPMGREEALAVALDGEERPVDAGRVNGQMFVVMAGLGLDARMLAGTSDPLKKRLGWVAYVISAAGHLRDRPMRVTVSADGGPRSRLRATALIVGNVGLLQGGLPLLPDARPDDGRLDAVVLSARGLAGWLAAATAIVLRRPARDRIHRLQFTELEVTVARGEPWELDGEVMGSTRRLTVTAQPGALLLRTPPSRPEPVSGPPSTRPASPATEVDTGPAGPAVGAFFDLDGTLVAGYTAAAQTRDRLRRRDLRVVEFLTIVDLAVQFRLGRRAFETLIEGSALTVRGRPAREVDEMGERIFRQSVADLVYPEMRELVRAHQRRGHTVVLSSSALTNQVAPVARSLGIGHIVCNRLVADEQGLLTGEVEQPVVWGPTKASGVQQFAAEHQVDLGASYFYADGDEDLSLMRLVGHPRPVNPGPALAKEAGRRGWPVLRFRSRGSGGLSGIARRLASVSSIGPLGVVALGIGLARRNKRAGVNFLTRVWPGTVLALNGIKLNVTGAEHLTERRPAVFLFNRRSSADVFLVAALLRDNWTGATAGEVPRSRVFGQLGRVLDVMFVDRGHPGAGSAARRPLEAAVSRGLSILVAPEGNRPGTRGVGPFKRKAFLIAMAAGLPVVPIVIRNSELVAGRQSVKLNPGTVDIAVLPPVSVAHWNSRNLRDRIARVQADYQRTLAHWPAQEPGAGRD